MRYDHINIGARDVERLSDFYEQALNCVRLSSIERMSGGLMARGMGLQEAEVRAVWMRLPGHGEEGPILELFEYTEPREQPKSSANQRGYNHIGFEVADVEVTVEAVIAAGGTRLGEVVDFESPSVGIVTFVFLRDPEDNIIQLIHYPE